MRGVSKKSRGRSSQTRQATECVDTPSRVSMLPAASPHRVKNELRKLFYCKQYNNHLQPTLQVIDDNYGVVFIIIKLNNGDKIVDAM